MRMRKKKNLAPRLLRCADVMIEDPFAQRGRFSELFSEDRPLYLEIGAGKGAFLRKMCAREDRNFNYIALEKVPEALIMAMERAKEENIADLKFISEDAARLTEMFAPGEVAKIFLNFSDPWPKSRQKKRRLTHESFLKQYIEVLSSDGEVIFKTDNARLFEFSLCEFSKCGFVLKELTLDLHNSKYAGDNCTTEYEDRFVALGQPIYRVVAAKRA
ncbi:MAG: tRNA (guanosine(46)-N7)-methyltransferase TrmB [Clostridia bacterium]|nr:tRNA (guanosine(46)-N7)-methyltransferase TrmB [Clostridia bacterium]